MDEQEVQRLRNERPIFQNVDMNDVAQIPLLGEEHILCELPVTPGNRWPNEARVFNRTALAEHVQMPEFHDNERVPPQATPEVNEEEQWHQLVDQAAEAMDQDLGLPERPPTPWAVEPVDVALRATPMRAPRMRLADRIRDINPVRIARPAGWVNHRRGEQGPRPRFPPRAPWRH